MLLVLLQQDPVHLPADLVGLIELLQGAPKNDYRMKQDILKTLKRCFMENPRAKDAFRENGGFVCTVSLLVSLEESLLTPTQIEALTQNPATLTPIRSATTTSWHALTEAMAIAQQQQPTLAATVPPPGPKQFTELELGAKASLVVTIFRLITAAITGHVKNRAFFREQIVCTLAGSLKLTGLLPTPMALKVCCIPVRR